MGMILSVIGGFPLKVGRKVVAENLKISKSIMPYFGKGSLPSASMLMNLAQSVAGGGMGAIVGNPIGALTSSLSGGLSGALGQLSGVEGMGSLSSALSSAAGGGGLAGALSSLTNSSNLLSGVTNALGADQFGPMQVLNHLEMVNQGIGSASSIGAMLGPLNTGDFLGTVQAQLAPMVESVIDGSMSVEDAVAQVNDWSHQIRNVVDNSKNAMMAGQANAVRLAGAVSLLTEIAAPANPLAEEYLNKIVHPAVTANLRPDTPPAT